MEHFREFEKEQNQNLLKGVAALLCLRKPLERFIDEEIGIFHQMLVDECGANLCVKNCNFNNWKPQQNQSRPLCEVCSSWRDSILANHTSPRGKVMWKNSKPDRWSQDKWEVAKVANVRNNIMHAASFQLKQEDWLNYFNRIRKLAEVLGKDVPEFKSLSKDIDEIQNLDCRLIFPDDMAAQKSQAQDEKHLEDIYLAYVQEVAEHHLTRMRLEKLERQQESMPLDRVRISTDKDKAKFVDDNRAKLIQDVTMVMAITEELGDMVHPEAYSLINATATSRDKMRVLYDNSLRSGGEVVKAAFYDALKKHHPGLV